MAGPHTVRAPAGTADKAADKQAVADMRAADKPAADKRAEPAVAAAATEQAAVDIAAAADTAAVPADSYCYPSRISLFKVIPRLF